MFITVEGLDASGKTTLVKKLTEYLSINWPNLQYISTREPGGKDLVEAEKIRQIILDNKSILSDVSEALLYTASRRIHLERVIWPALKEKKLVICDRYTDSFHAYQGYARGLGYEYTKKMTDLVMTDSNISATPNITIFLDFQPEKRISRLQNCDIISENDRLENEDLEFHKKVYNGYKELIKKDPERFIVIDANQSIDNVLNEVIEKLKKNTEFYTFITQKKEIL